MKKKNNAIEKIENITEKSAYNTINDELAKESEAIKEQERETFAKAEKEKKLNAQKAKEAKREVLNRRREDYKREKQRKREERIARRNMLKRESADERQKRRTAEKEARARERKNGGGVGGWIAAVAVLGTATLVFATLFTISMLDGFGIDVTPDNSVAETYYDLVDYVDNMDVNMSKLLVSSDNARRQKILGELSTQASLAADDISRLPLKDDGKFYTTKFVNQVSDYAKYLNNRLIDGFSLSQKDEENLEKLYEINGTLKRELSTLTDEMDGKFDFNTLLNDNDDNIVLDKFIELESNAVDYPKLIYDGPFSDALDTPFPKAIIGDEINTSKAEEIFKKTFAKYGVFNVETVGESHGTIESFNVEADVKDGTLYAQIAKRGGTVVLFNCFKDCKENVYGLKSCVEAGEKFLAELGYENMKAVWATESGTTVYANFCPVVGGAVIYPDMIKLTVCKERGVVSGYDANEYLLNHIVRSVEKASITETDAVKNLSTKLKVQSVRLAVIPLGNSDEALCYEVCGTAMGAVYYIYVNATSGKEEQIFRVVESTEGTLLI